MEQSQQDKHPITSVSGTKDLLSFKDQAEARKYFNIHKKEVLIHYIYKLELTSTGHCEGQRLLKKK